MWKMFDKKTTLVIIREEWSLSTTKTISFVDSQGSYRLEITTIHLCKQKMHYTRKKVHDHHKENTQQKISYLYQETPIQGCRQIKQLYLLGFVICYVHVFLFDKESLAKQALQFRHFNFLTLVVNLYISQKVLLIQVLLNLYHIS